jgi:hypothetical protein
MGSHAERSPATDKSSVRVQFRTPANPCERRKTTPLVSGRNPARELPVLIMPLGWRPDRESHVLRRSLASKAAIVA